METTLMMQQVFLDMNTGSEATLGTGLTAQRFCEPSWNMAGDRESPVLLLRAR